MDRQRWVGGAAAVAETVAALVFCIAISLALTLIWIPTDRSDRFELLRDEDGVEDDLPEATDLIARLAARYPEAIIDIGESPEHERLRLEVQGPEAVSIEELREVLSPVGVEVVRGQSEVDIALDRMDTATVAWAVGSQSVVFLAAGFLLSRRRSQRLLPANRPSSRCGTAVATMAGVGAGLASFAAAVAVAVVLRAVGWSPREQDWLVELLARREHLIAIAPLIVVLAPLAEEVFFRGYVQRRIARSAGVAAGLVLSSVLFAVVHFNPSGLLIYASVGLVLGGVHLRTGRLLAAIVGHAIYNAIVLASTLMVMGG